MIRAKALPINIFNVEGRLSVEERKKFTPSGNIPFLDTGSFILSDSEAICGYLETQHGKTLLPEDSAKQHQDKLLCEISSTQILPHALGLLPALMSGEQNKEIIESKMALLDEGLKQLDPMILLCRSSTDLQSTTYADCCLLPSLCTMEQLIGLLGMPSLIEKYDLVKAYWEGKKADPISTETITELAKGITERMTCSA